MRSFTIAAILLLALSALASAQDSKNAVYVKPAIEAGDQSRCGELQVKALYASTDLSQSLEEQEKLLNAAKAYGELHGLGQPC